MATLEILFLKVNAWSVFQLSWQSSINDCSWICWLGPVGIRPKRSRSENHLPELREDLIYWKIKFVLEPYLPLCRFALFGSSIFPFLDFWHSSDVTLTRSREHYSGQVSAKREVMGFEEANIKLRYLSNSVGYFPFFVFFFPFVISVHYRESSILSVNIWTPVKINITITKNTFPLFTPFFCFLLFGY